MQIKVAKQDLEAALQLVTPSMGNTGTTDDISVHYLFRAKEADDGEIAVEVLTCYSSMFSTAAVSGTVVTLEDGGPRMFTIEGKRLRQWVRSVSDAALTLDYDKKEAEVTVTAPMGSQRFPSVDPSKFRLWDKLVQNVKPKTKIKASQLQSAFNFVHRFVHDDPQKQALQVFEARSGKLLAANPHSAAIVTPPDLGDCAFRLYGKDGLKFVGFLGAAEDDEIEVLESDRAVVFKRPDGALMGERRPDKGFPKDAQAGKDADKDQHWLELPVAEVKRHIKFLTSGADVADNRLRIRRDVETDAVYLSMETVTGKTTQTEVEGVQFGSQDGADALPTKGMLVSHPILKKLLDLHEGDTIRIGINRRGKSGYFRYSAEADSVEFLLVMAWLKESR